MDHSVPTPNKIYTGGLIQRLRTLVKSPLGIRPYVTVQFQISILELGFEIIKISGSRDEQVEMRKPRSLLFANSRTPNGIPTESRYCATLSLFLIYLFSNCEIAITAPNSLSYFAILASLNNSKVIFIFL